MGNDILSPSRKQRVSKDFNAARNELFDNQVMSEAETKISDSLTGPTDLSPQFTGFWTMRSQGSDQPSKYDYPRPSIEWLFPGIRFHLPCCNHRRGIQGAAEVAEHHIGKYVPEPN